MWPVDDLRALSPLLGRSADSEAVREFFARLGDLRPFEVVEDVGFLEYKAKGISVMLKKAGSPGRESTEDERTGFRVDGIHFYREGFDGYKQYDGKLLGGVDFLLPRHGIRSRLGNPDATGGGNVKFYDKTQIWPKWDRYDFADCSIRFQYDDAEMPSVVTVMGRG